MYILKKKSIWRKQKHTKTSVRSKQYPKQGTLVWNPFKHFMIKKKALYKIQTSYYECNFWSNRGGNAVHYILHSNAWVWLPLWLLFRKQSQRFWEYALQNMKYVWFSLLFLKCSRVLAEEVLMHHFELQEKTAAVVLFIGQL